MDANATSDANAKFFVESTFLQVSDALTFIDTSKYDEQVITCTCSLVALASHQSA